MRRTTLLIGLLVAALSLTLVACGGGDDKSDQAKRRPGESPYGPKRAGLSEGIQKLPDIPQKVPGPSAATRKPLDTVERFELDRAMKMIAKYCKGQPASPQGHYDVATNLDGLILPMLYKPDARFNGTTIRKLAGQTAQTLQVCASDQAYRITRSLGNGTTADGRA